MIPLILTKLLLVFAYPLGGALLVGAAAVALSFTRWRPFGQVLLGCTLIGLWVAATPVFANWLNWQVESRLPPLSMEALPQSDVVIVLGGASATRILGAWRIYRAGKTPRVVISGGNLPWQAQAVPESQLTADLLIELGVPHPVLILEQQSRTNRENALNTAAIFNEHNWRNGLLVTSGLHMPRALAAFQ